MKIEIACIIPLTKEASKQFLSKFSNEKIIDATSSASQILQERYTTLQEDNKILSKLFQQYFFDSTSQNRAVTKENNNTVIFQLIYQTKLTDLATLSADCNHYCNQYISNLLDLDSNTIHYLWINRTLIAASKAVNSQLSLIKENWLLTEKNIEQELLERNYILCWGNNLMFESFTHKEDLLQSLIMMQFNYIDLDIVNIQLNRLMERISKLANTSGKPKRKELIKRKNDILTLQKEVEKTLIDFNDELINLQSFKQIYHNKIVEVWQIDILISACRQKLRYCQDEVTIIDNELEERANFQADLLLFIIGLFGVLSYFLDLSQVFDSLSFQKLLRIDALFSQTSFGIMHLIALLMCSFAVIHFICRRR